MSSDLNFYKKNGYIVKKNLINQKIINQINKVVNQVVSNEKNKRKKNNVNGTQSYDNYHFVYNSTSSKNKEILRLNNPQNRHKIFYELSRTVKKGMILVINENGHSYPRFYRYLHAKHGFKIVSTIPILKECVLIYSVKV